MSLKLTSITDPRDSLEKTRRKPLENYIRAYHPEMYQHNMPAALMRQLLRMKGVHEIKDVPRHSLGKEQEDFPTIDADALLRAEWEASLQMKKSMGMAELRKAVKARGITAPRTATKADLEKMLNDG